MSIVCDSPGLMPLEQALQRIFTNTDPVNVVELLQTDAILGRVLAESIKSPIDVPSFDNSAMDGYALNTSELTSEKPLTVIGKSFAGNPFVGKVNDGECVKVMTGGVIPDGANAVVPQENVTTSGNSIQVDHVPKLGDAIRCAGSDIRLGAEVLVKGKKISPIDIGLLASLGLAKVKVFRKLKVAVFSTGDELLSAGEQMRPGCIYDSNKAMLSAMLSALDYDVIDMGKVADDKEQLRLVIAEADAMADVVITTGGVSVGEADYTRLILEEMGEIGFWKIAMKPGKPLAFGKLPNSVFFGLPGNPVSAAATFLQLAQPALAKLSGAAVESIFTLHATADARFRKRPGRADFQRATHWVDESGQLKVKPAGTQSSGVLSSFATSNCFAVLEQQRGNVEPGERVCIQPFATLLSTNL